MKNALQVQENRTRLPVCFLHNRKLKAKCAKERAQNKRRRVCVCACVCMYAYMYVHNEAVPNGRCKRRRSKARRNGGVSVHLSMLRRVGRAPLLPTLVFYTSSFVVVSCTALSHTDACLYVYVYAVYNTYDHR